MRHHSLALAPFLLIATLIAIGGCDRHRLPPAVQKPLPAEEALLTERLSARADYWKAYQAKVRIRAEGPRGNYRFQGIVLARLPGQFRFEAFNFFGQTVGVLRLSEGESTLWVPSEKASYSATSPEALIKHFLGVPVPPEAFAYSLIATIPPRLLSRLSLSPAESGWVASVTEDQGLETTWELSSQPLALKALSTRAKTWTYRMDYDPAVLLEQEEIPRRINFTTPEGRMEVTVEHLSRAPDLQDSAFTLPIPAGTRTIQLDR